MHPTTQYRDSNFVLQSHAYDRKTTIHHYQLRDLICCTDKPYEFYSVHDKQTLLYNVRTAETTVAQDLQFRPYCMTYRSGFLAAGGPHSELEVTNVRDGSIVFKAPVGGAVNNALHISSNSCGRLQLYVCNNDKTIKVFSLPDMQLTTTISTQVPMNYVSVSENGKYLVCVGDCRTTLVFEATPTGYRLHNSFTEAQDHGMCCAWNPHSSCLAAAFQDGIVSVWDFNSGRTVAKYHNRRACRNIKFSPGPVDLMAFTEHDGRCHLVDARRWDQVQVLHPGECDSHISGCAFTPGGRALYVGLETHVMAYELDTARRCSFGAASVA